MAVPKWYLDPQFKAWLALRPQYAWPNEEDVLTLDTVRATEMATLYQEYLKNKDAGGAEEGGGEGGGEGEVAESTYGTTTTLQDIIDAINRKDGKTPASFYEAPAPFTYPNFTAPTFDTPEFTPPNPFEFETYQAPADFAYPEFVAPTGEQVLAEDPGYGFRLSEALRALKNSSAAEGLYRSGGAQKALEQYASGLASQEYGAAYGRKFGEWGANAGLAADTYKTNATKNLTDYTTRRGAASEDYDRLRKNSLMDYSVKYGAEGDEYGRALETYKTNLGKAATGYGFGLDVAAGKAGGTQGAQTLQGNLVLGGINSSQAASNAYWDRLVAMMGLYNQNLPTP
jgi:hypothetical protein